MFDPAVSVIVCTRDRPQQLLRCIASVASAARRCPEFESEIIVIENLSRPHLALAELDVLQAAGGRAQFVTMDVGGLAKARNAGLKNARGRLFVFTDDDCIMDADFMVNLRDHEATWPHHVFLGGRVKLADPEDLPFTIKDEPEAQVYDATVHPGGFIHGCNFVVSRATADLIGEFDPQFGAGAYFGAGEDSDYIIRGYLAKLRIQYVPDLIVFHQHGRRTRLEIEVLIKRYSFANGALYLKYIGELWLLRHLFWSIRSAVKEKFGGPTFNSEIGLSFYLVAIANVLGFFAYMLRVGCTAFGLSLGASAGADPAKIR